MFNRYQPQMLDALSRQSNASIAVYAVVRAIIINLAVQLFAYLSGFSVSTLLQSVLLIGLFTGILFAIDIIEKYWAQKRVSDRQIRS